MATKTVAQLTAVISANNTKFKKGINGSKKSLGGFQKSVVKIGGVIASAFAAKALIAFSKEAKDLAAQMQGVNQAFNKLDNSKVVLEKLRKATRNTVSDLELMQNAIKADNFKIPMDVLAKGLEFATKRAAQTGESVDYLVDSFTTGLGRQSVMILDNLGISATELNKEVKKTGDFMTAVGNITDRELTKMGDVILTDAQKMAQFQTNVTNAKTGFGELVTRGFTPFIDVGNRVFEVINRQSKALTQEKTELNSLVTVATSATISEEARLKVIEDIQKKYPDFLGNIGAEKVSNEQLKKSLVKVNEQYVERIRLSILEETLAGQERKLTKQIAEEIQWTRNLASAKKTLAYEQEQYRQSLKDNNGEASIWLERVRSSQRDIDRYNGYIGDAKNGQEKWTSTIDGTVESIVLQTKVVEELINGQNELNRSTSGANDAIKKQALLLAPDLRNAAAPSLTLRTTDKIFDESFFTNADLGKGKMKELKDESKDLSDTLAVAFSQIGSSFAQSLGEVAAGTRTLGEALQDIGSMILGALGDILIMTGLSTSPIGVPLVLAGLALKGIGAFIGSSDFGGNNQQARLSGAYVNPNKNVLYGNDIRTSGDYYTNVYNKVG